MSGSPKYTTVAFEAARQAQLEAARRLREQERRRREEERGRQRIQAALQAAQQRAARLGTAIDALRVRAAGLPQLAEVTALATRAGTLSAAVPADEARISRLHKDLRDLERRTDRVGAAVARELTVREHGSALDLVLAALDGTDDRAALDPAGYRAVEEHLAQARGRTGDTARFTTAYDSLSGEVAAHLERVRDRRALLQRLAAETDEVVGALTAVLADADAAGIVVPDADRVTASIAELRGEAGGQETGRWERRIAALCRTTEEVTAYLDARLDQLERVSIVVEAASAALPEAGLRVVRGSLVEQDGSVTFRAERTDGTPIHLTVFAGDGRGTRVEYRTDGGDTVVETTADGDVRRCDLTEQLLESFHTELGRQGVRADGLHWAGKPDEPRQPYTQGASVTAPQQRRQG